MYSSTVGVLLSCSPTTNYVPQVPVFYLYLEVALQYGYLGTVCLPACGTEVDSVRGTEAPHAQPVPIVLIVLIVLVVSSIAVSRYSTGS